MGGVQNTVAAGVESAVARARVDDSLEEIVAAALDRGDRRAALQLLMSACGDRIHAYCVRLLGNAVLADDVLQQVFVQAYEGLPRYRRRSRVVSWLLAIANHRCLDALKATRRWSRRFGGGRDAPEPVADVPDPLQRIDSVQVAAALEAGLSKLSPHVRMAVLLHHHEGLSFEEMERMLGEKSATLQARVARAMPFLRKSLLARGVSVS